MKKTLTNSCPETQLSTGTTETHSDTNRSSTRIELHFDYYEDLHEVLLVLNATKLFLALNDIDNYCRGLLKHGDISDETYKHLEEIRRMVWDSPYRELS